MAAHARCTVWWLAAALAGCGGGSSSPTDTIARALAEPPACDMSRDACTVAPALRSFKPAQRQQAGATVPSADALMSWAEGQFPTLFAPAAATVQAAGFSYRFYAAS